MNLTPDSWQSWAGLIGPIATIFLAIIIAGYRGAWAWGWYVEELKVRIGKLETQLEKTLKISERATAVLQDAVHNTSDSNEILRQVLDLMVQINEGTPVLPPPRKKSILLRRRRPTQETTQEAEEDP